MIEEERSSSESASEIKCAICGKVLKDKRAIGSHMRKHKKPQAAVNPPPLPQAPQLLQNPLPPQPQVQPLLQTPQAPQPDIAPIIALLSGLLTERKDPIKEKLEQAFMNWLDTVFSLPSIFTKGYGKGLEEAMKSYVREAVKEELRDLKEVIDKVLRREEKREEHRREEARA